MRKTAFLLQEEQIYMCGHSLGPITKLAKSQIEQVVQAWEKHAVQAWNTEAWIDLPHQVAARIAPFIGADCNDVVMSDSTSVNLFRVLMSALKINYQRHVILTTDDNFPADHYIAEGIQSCHPKIVIKTVSRENLIDSLDEQVAVLMLTQVNYRDASLYDMCDITARCHKQGILTIWDLSHSTGALPIKLQTSMADFAVGCTYKYLNGGPGSPAFIYAHKRHQNQLHTPIYGWMGHSKPFDFAPHYQSQGITQFLGGTPYVLSLKGLEGALKTIEGIDQDASYTKSLEHSEFLIKALQALGLKVLTSLDAPRGGHVAFLHPDAYALSRALIEHGVIVDYRKPDLIRMCITPLYLNLSDIQQSIIRLTALLETKKYLSPHYKQTLKVT